MDASNKMGTPGKIATVGAGLLLATATYTALRSEDGKANDYFKAQDAGRKLTRRTFPQQDLAEMMFSKGAHQGKKPPLVYGLEDESREPLRNKYHMPPGFEKRVITPLSIATAGPFTADHFNNVTWRGFAEKDKKPDQSIFNEKTDKRLKASGSYPANVKSDLETWRAALPDKYKTKAHDDFFVELMKHPRYSPAKTGAGNEKEMLDREGGSDGAKAKFQSQTRRSSKFGLEHQRKNNQNVAFMLDFPKFGSEPDDYSFQINKTKTGNRAGGQKSGERVPITTSEMRKAYRDKDEAGTQPTFFAGGQKVAAPWVKRADQWEKYGDYRLQKYEDAWNKSSSSALAAHKSDSTYAGMSSNQKANYLKQKWLETGQEIPRVKNKPELVSPPKPKPELVPRSKL